MSTNKRENIGWTLREIMVKIAVLSVTITIGLWCGWHDSYVSFYVAVLVQAINNAYDASNFFSGYKLFITVFQVISFICAIFSVIIAIIFFASGETVFNTFGWVIGIAIALSIPLVHFGIEVYFLLRDNRY